MGTVNLDKTILCEECEESDLLFDADGPDGRPVWVCMGCGRFWEDRDGMPDGPGEAFGEFRDAHVRIKWPSH